MPCKFARVLQIFQVAFIWTILNLGESVWLEIKSVISFDNNVWWADEVVKYTGGGSGGGGE